MSNRQVTERDLRAPDLRDADPKDYEFREDGAVVRKDRWERGMRAIASTVIGDRREWEISEVVEIVRKRHPSIPVFAIEAATDALQVFLDAIDAEMAESAVKSCLLANDRVNTAQQISTLREFLVQVAEAK